MTTPGQSSGTQTFFLSNAEVTFEAFDRARIRPEMITRHHLISARRSYNLIFKEWANKGINLWEVVEATLTLFAGQATYTLPTNLVTITEMYYTTINGNGVGYNSDRIMVPITRQQYSMIPNKLQPGLPTQYWLERYNAPTVTIWQPSFQGAPNYTISYNYIQKIQDVGLATGQTPDTVDRALDALCAALAYRLAMKFTPAAEAQTLIPMLKTDAMDAWNAFVTNDQEDGPILVQPNVGGYAKMRL